MYTTQDDTTPHRPKNAQRNNTTTGTTQHKTKTNEHNNIINNNNTTETTTKHAKHKRGHTQPIHQSRPKQTIKHNKTKPDQTHDQRITENTNWTK